MVYLLLDFMKFLVLLICMPDSNTIHQNQNTIFLFIKHMKNTGP